MSHSLVDIPIPNQKPPPSHFLIGMLIPDIITNLAGFFRADQICTPVASAVTVDLTEIPATAHKRLKSAKFDQPPVMREGRPVGWVTTEALARLEPIKFSMTRLEDCVLISAESSIARVLPLLTEHKFLYVIGTGDVLGPATPSAISMIFLRSYMCASKVCW